MDIKAFTSFLHSNIPLTEFMDIQIETYTPEKVKFRNFAQNKNDKNTGFAGSISTLMTTAGLSCICQFLYELLPKGNIVAQKTQLRVHCPHHYDFRAECICNDPKQNRLCWILSQKEEGKLITTSNVSAGIC